MEKSKLKTGGIAKFIEEAKNSQNNPNVLNKIIEAMSEKIDELQSKAAAYDRLMGGGRKTLNEMANFFGLIVSVEPDGDILLWEVIPNRSRDGWYGKKCVKRLPKLFSDFNGDWKDSLTLPDGWEGTK